MTSKKPTQTENGVGAILLFFSGVILLGFILFLFKATSFVQSYQPVHAEEKISVSPTPESVSYKDENIRFDYPFNMKVLQDQEADYYTRMNGNFRKNFSGYVQYSPPEVEKILVVQDKNKEGVDDSSPVTIWEFKNPDNLSEAGWYNNYWYYPFVWGMFSQPQKGEVAPTKQLKIDGKVTYYNQVNYQPGQPKFIYLRTSGSMILIRVLNDIDLTSILKNFSF